jgi:decaprenylphospho-beta-D-erythro-pentofuranosid-2-ulose 2-reductase
MRLLGSGGDAGFAHRRVMVIGASSEIAGAIVEELPPCPERELALLGRRGERLHQAAERLTATGALVHEIEVDARDVSTHRAAVDRAVGLLGGVDLVILAVGILGERGAAPEDIPAAAEVLAVNAAGAGSLLLESARVLRGQGHGSIVVLSSVAAERARASNAVYCASKAGLDSLAQGLSEDLEPAGVNVLVVRPGFVRTRMTAGLPVPAGATDAQTVARATVRGLARGASTVWAPTQLRWVMIVIRLLPRAIMRRLPL